MPASKPFFSIIIPTLNEENYLPLLLKDLTKQSFVDFEVIVVDADSIDQTTKRARSFIKRLPLTILNSNQAHVSVQRNLGATKAKSDWLIFMDADVRLPAYFLEGIKYQIIKNTHAHMFSCLIAPDDQRNTTAAIIKAANTVLLLYNRINKPMALGSMIIIQKQVFKKITFNERIKINEDLELIRDAIAAGYSFVLANEPLYVASLRRMRKEGVIKLSAIVAKAIIHRDFLNQSALDNNYGYVMQGGAYYELADKKSRSNRNKKIIKITKAQLEKINTFLNKF